MTIFGKFLPYQISCHLLHGHFGQCNHILTSIFDCGVIRHDSSMYIVCRLQYRGRIKRLIAHKGNNMDSLKDRLATLKAQQVSLQAELAKAQAEVATLAQARNTAITDGIKTLTDGITLSIKSATFPDNDVYPITISVNADGGFTVNVASVKGHRESRGGRSILYNGSMYASGQALVDYLVIHGLISGVPTTNYSAPRFLRAKGIQFTEV